MRLTKVKIVEKDNYWIPVARLMALPYLKTIFISILLLFSAYHSSAQVPNPDFTANVTSGCSPLSVQFTDKSTGNPTFWNWDLGNGQLSTLQNPITSYSTPGTYTITLVVRNANGINSITKTNYIVINQSPSAAFTADITTACVPATINFTDASNPNAGTINQWFWDFGDGTTSTLQNPSKSYSTVGFYTVLLRVTSSTGCQSAVAKGNYIRIVSGVTADFNITDPVTCSAPFIANFSNQTSGPGTLNYNWDFGNSTTSTNQNPTATYAAPGTYTINLTATSQFGCSGTKQKTITIPSITTSFNAPDTVCLNSLVNFQNNSSPVPAQSVWDFGNGKGSIKINDTSRYTTAGSYTVKLVNTYSTCTDSFSKVVYARPNPTVDFTAPAVVACQGPFTVNFQDLSPDAVSWQWDFGDGGTSNAKNPSHTYNTTGQYDVRLTITDSRGCSNTILKSAFVRIIAPTITISNAPNGGCVPFTYSPNPVANAIDGVASYAWDFGDGFTSTSANPTHTYASIGNYTIQLTITTVGGCTATVQYTNGIRVGTPPATNFTFSPLTACASGAVQFTDLTPVADAWVWQFGDGGTSSQQNPIYNYTDTGYFNVTLTAYNNGCAFSLTSVQQVHVLPPTASFTYQVSCANKRLVVFTNTSKTDPAIVPLTYFWEFGDPLNTTSTLANPAFTYPALGTYTVRLTVTNGTCSQTFTLPVALNSDIADFSASKFNVCRNESVSFTAINSLPANIASYEWAFDGGPYTVYGFAVSNRYTAVGPHSISLIITDVNGCKDTLTKNPAVIVSGPTANFSWSPTGACQNKNIGFTDISTFTNPIVQWKWNFGDGQIQNFNSAPFNHQYADTGRYTVTLTVTDNIGCIDSVPSSIPIWITKPIAKFGVGSTLICAGGQMQFLDSSKGYGLNYSWDFGDGNSGTGPNPIHVYTGVDSTYSVKLVITDTVGCTDSVTRLNFISIRSPKSIFTAKDTSSLCPPLETKFTFQGQNYQSFYWDFGDGSLSTLTNPNHFYNSYGSFTAKLVVTGFGGCLDSSSTVINVYDPNTSVSLNYSPLQGCNSLLVDFNITTPPNTKLYFYSSDAAADSSQRRQFQYLYKTLGYYSPVIYVKDSTGCLVGFGGAQQIKVLGAEPLFGMDKKAFCDTGTVLFGNFTIFNDPIVSSVWDFGDGGTSNLQEPSHRYTTAGTYIPSLTVTTQAGCSKTLTDTVRVYQTPTPVISGDTVVCINDLLLLQGSLVIADTLTTWKWDFGNGNSSSIKNTSTKYGATGNYTIKLDAANKLGCGSSTTHRVYVPPAPIITFGPDPVIPVGTTIPIPVTYGPNISTYTWLPATGLSCANCPVPVAGPKSTTKYKVTVEDIYGCNNSSDITVIVVCNDKNFFIPNTFSPNNDGQNDVFYPRGTGLARVQSMRIFNRWGELVYERKNFNANDPSVGWDGTYKGKKGEMDTYVYLIELVCENSVVIPYKGNVTLIR